MRRGWCEEVWRLVRGSDMAEWGSGGMERGSEVGITFRGLNEIQIQNLHWKVDSKRHTGNSPTSRVCEI
jgi:hypothetical protein